MASCIIKPLPHDQSFIKLVVSWSLLPGFYSKQACGKHFLLGFIMYMLCSFKHLEANLQQHTLARTLIASAGKNFGSKSHFITGIWWTREHPGHLLCCGGKEGRS